MIIVIILITLINASIMPSYVIVLWIWQRYHMRWRCWLQCSIFTVQYWTDFADRGAVMENRCSLSLDEKLSGEPMEKLTSMNCRGCLESKYTCEYSINKIITSQNTESNKVSWMVKDTWIAHKRKNSPSVKSQTDVYKKVKKNKSFLVACHFSGQINIYD